MGKVDLILEAIKAGVPTAKLISKYGKKAVDEVFVKWFTKKPEVQILKSKLGHKSKPKVDEIKWKPVKTKKDYSKIEKEVMDLAKKTYRPKSAGGAVNSRAIAKKYFKGGLV